MLPEMVENMKVVASSDVELTVEERNLLSVAYKNVIGARRASWRIVTSIEQKEESKGNETQVGLIKEYRQKIEAELAKICDDILEVLDKHLLPSAQSGESKVFYHKMLVPNPAVFLELLIPPCPLTGKETTTVTWPSLLLVTDARLLPMPLSPLTRPRPKLPRLTLPRRTPSALVSLSTSPSFTTKFSTLPIRLAISRNLLLTMQLPVRIYIYIYISIIVCKLLSTNIKLAELDTLNEESYKDSTLIMQLLRDNLVSGLPMDAHTWLATF